MWESILNNAIYYQNLVRQNILPILGMLIALWFGIFIHIRRNYLGPIELKNMANYRFSYFSLWLCLFSFIFIIISFFFDNSLGIYLRMSGVTLFIISVLNFLGFKPISDYRISRRYKQSY